MLTRHCIRVTHIHNAPLLHVLCKITAAHQHHARRLTTNRGLLDWLSGSTAPEDTENASMVPLDQLPAETHGPLVRCAPTQPTHHPTHRHTLPISPRPSCCTALLRVRCSEYAPCSAAWKPTWSLYGETPTPLFKTNCLAQVITTSPSTLDVTLEQALQTGANPFQPVRSVCRQPRRAFTTSSAAGDWHTARGGPVWDDP